jgi:hypothetical protein
MRTGQQSSLSSRRRLEGRSEALSPAAGTADCPSPPIAPRAAAFVRSIVASASCARSAVGSKVFGVAALQTAACEVCRPTSSCRRTGTRRCTDTAQTGRCARNCSSVSEVGKGERQMETTIRSGVIGRRPWLGAAVAVLTATACAQQKETSSAQGAQGKSSVTPRKSGRSQRRHTSTATR